MYVAPIEVAQKVSEATLLRVHVEEGGATAIGAHPLIPSRGGKRQNPPHPLVPRGGHRVGAEEACARIPETVVKNKDLSLDLGMLAMSAWWRVWRLRGARPSCL